MGHRMKKDSGDDGFTLLGMNLISFFFPSHCTTSFRYVGYNTGNMSREWGWLERECVIFSKLIKVENSVTETLLPFSTTCGL